jgi:hypothetical protein
MQLTNVSYFLWFLIVGCSASVLKPYFKNVRIDGLESNKLATHKNDESVSNDKQKVGILFLNLGGPKTLKVKIVVTFGSCGLT